jgi:hypothetical protein
MREVPSGDLARANTIEPDLTYPDKVQLRLVWLVKGRAHIRQIEITAEEFFGRGSFGAPIPAEAIVQLLEIMRRRGAPKESVPMRPSRKPNRG